MLSGMYVRLVAMSNTLHPHKKVANIILHFTVYSLYSLTSPTGALALAKTNLPPHVQYYCTYSMEQITLMLLSYCTVNWCRLWYTFFTWVRRLSSVHCYLYLDVECGSVLSRWVHGRWLICTLCWLLNTVIITVPGCWLWYTVGNPLRSNRCCWVWSTGFGTWWAPLCCIPTNQKHDRYSTDKTANQRGYRLHTVLKIRFMYS